VTDGWTNRQNYDPQDRANIAASRGKDVLLIDALTSQLNEQVMDYEPDRTSRVIRETIWIRKTDTNRDDSSYCTILFVIAEIF